LENINNAIKHKNHRMTYIIIALLLVIAGYLVFIYNKLIRLRNLVNEAWSGIDVQLKKRYELVPLLVKTVEGYARHEKTLLESITMLRSKGIQANTLKEQEMAVVGLSKALGNLFVIVENYPELKANENFLVLQREISKVEHDLQRARRYYNGSVRNYNILIEQFPSNLVANVASHKQRDYFDIKNETERSVPGVGL
jgi:LemA protein